MIINLVSTTDRNLKVERNRMGEEEEERIRVFMSYKIRTQWRSVEINGRNGFEHII